MGSGTNFSTCTLNNFAAQSQNLEKNSQSALQTNRTVKTHEYGSCTKKWRTPMSRIVPIHVHIQRHMHRHVKASMSFCSYSHMHKLMRVCVQRMCANLHTYITRSIQSLPASESYKRIRGSLVPRRADRRFGQEESILLRVRRRWLRQKRHMHSPNQQLLSWNQH